MLSRVLATAIVLFWLAMSGLLVRLEFFPGAADLLPVPVDHLFKLMFLHEQASDLIVFRDGARIGDLHLQPHRFPAGAAGAGKSRNLLSGTGSMLLALSGIEAQHLTVRGALDLDESNAVQHFELTASLHDPGQKTPSLIIVCNGEPPADRYHYQIRQGDAVRAEQTGTASALLEQADLRGLGLNPAVLGTIATQQSAATQLSAQRGVLRSKGEDIETYDVLVRQGDTLAATLQLSQLGQVLAVKTFAGYSLLDQSLAP